MELVEVRFDNDGQDPFPMFMSRHRCPKDRDDIEPDFPLTAMEITDEEVKQYFTPVDFAVGKTIVVYGRRFLIYDVDNFTKAFYWKNFGMTDFTPVDVDIPKPPLPKQVQHAADALTNLSFVAFFLPLTRRCLSHVGWALTDNRV